MRATSLGQAAGLGSQAPPGPGRRQRPRPAVGRGGFPGPSDDGCRGVSRRHHGSHRGTGWFWTPVQEGPQRRCHMVSSIIFNSSAGRLPAFTGVSLRTRRVVLRTRGGGAPNTANARAAQGPPRGRRAGTCRGGHGAGGARARQSHLVAPQAAFLSSRPLSGWLFSGGPAAACVVRAGS